MDALGARFIKGRSVVRLSSVLRFGTIVDFNMTIGREFMLGRNGISMSEKGFANVILCGEATNCFCGPNQGLDVA